VLCFGHRLAGLSPQPNTVTTRMPKLDWRWRAQTKATSLSHHRREERNTDVGEGCHRPPPASPRPPTPSPPLPAPPRCQTAATDKRHHRAPCRRGQKRRPAQAHLGPSWPGAHGRACRGATVARRRSQHLRRRPRSPPGGAAPRRRLAAGPRAVEAGANATAALARRSPRRRRPGFARRDPWRRREGGNGGGREEEACGRRRGHKGEEEPTAGEMR
jgi:hypothetical protein